MYGQGWKARQKANLERKAALSDPERMARLAETQARIEAERAESDRLNAEADARRRSELVQFPAMSMAMAADLIDAFARYKGAGRSSTPAQVDSVSRTVHGLDAYPGQAQVHFVSGLPRPVPMGSMTDAPAVASVKPQTDAAALDNVLKLPPSKGSRKPEKAPELESGQFLIED